MNSFQRFQCPRKSKNDFRIRWFFSKNERLMFNPRCAEYAFWHQVRGERWYSSSGEKLSNFYIQPFKKKHLMTWFHSGEYLINASTRCIGISQKKRSYIIFISELADVQVPTSLQHFQSWPTYNTEMNYYEYYVHITHAHTWSFRPYWSHWPRTISSRILSGNAKKKYVHCIYSKMVLTSFILFGNDIKLVR